MTIAILKGQSQNNVLREFSDSIAEGLIYHNTEVKLIDLTNEIGISDLNNLISSQQISGILSFNGILGDSLPNDFKIPFVSWFVDAPHYHLNRLQHVGGNRHVIFPSAHHTNFIKEANIQTSTSVLLAGARTINQKLSASSKKEHTILLAASWMGHPTPFWENLDNPSTKAIAKKIVEILDADQEVNVLLAAQTAAREMGLQFKINNNWIQLASLCHYYIRQKDRIEIVKTLTNTGLPFTLIGHGWENLAELGSNVNLIANIDNCHLQEYYSKSKIVVNLNASNGACERLFDAMSVGACIVSDYSNTLNELFKNGKDLIFFNRRKPELLSKSIEILLKKEKYYNISQRASEIVLNKHLWHHRAVTINNIFKSLK